MYFKEDVADTRSFLENDNFADIIKTLAWWHNLVYGHGTLIHTCQGQDCPIHFIYKKVIINIKRSGEWILIYT